MDLKKELLREHSKTQRDYIVNYIGNDEQRFEELMQLFLNDEYRVTQRASWVVSECSERFPFLITPYLESIILNLKNDVHDAVRRNTIRVLQFVEIPEPLFGITSEFCFELLASKKEPVAIKAFSMSVLFEIVKKIPELKTELQVLIEDQMPYSSPAFTSRGGKILKALKKI